MTPCIFDNVPPALSELVKINRWLTWHWEQKANGEWDKPPTDLNGYRMGANNPLNHRSFTDATGSVRAGRNDGIGFAPIKDSGYIFLDLDKCLNPETGDLLPQALYIVRRADSYTEVSPSGRGLRIIGYADGWMHADTITYYRLPDNSFGGEISTNSGYITITFDVISGANGPIRNISAIANELAAHGRAPSEGTSDHVSNPDKTAPIEVIRETMAMLPNDDHRNWIWWKETIGFALWEATEGSEEGRELWMEWSSQHPLYDEVEATLAWERMDAAPPMRKSFGTLLHEARKKQQALGNDWTGGPLWAVWTRDKRLPNLVEEAVARLTPLPPQPPFIGGGIGGGTTADIGGVAENRPIITISSEVGPIIEAADEALANTQPVWRMGNKLVTWHRQHIKAINGEEITLIGLGELDEAQLQVFLSNAVIWQRVEKRGRPKKAKDVGREATEKAAEDAPTAEPAEEPEFVRCLPPGNITRAVLVRQGDRPIRPIAAVTSVPVVRPDGSLVKAAGYDAVTRLLYLPDRNLKMPTGWDADHVTKEHAQEALEFIRGTLLENFGFEGKKGDEQYRTNETIALSGILTPIARNMMDVAPGHAFTARAVSSGKSLLVNLASKIAIGTSCPAAGAAISVEETEKSLTGLALQGVPIIALDNVNAELRSDLLCRMLSQDMVSLRALGRSEMFKVENRYSFFATGNNMQLTGDLIRRVLPCRLDVGEERPYNKKYAFNPMKRVAAERGKYVAAAIAVVRTFVLAGRPGLDKLTPLASYDDWTRTVRGALVWLGCPDPVNAMDNAREEDPDVMARREMLNAWRGKFGLDVYVTASAAADAVLSGSAINTAIDATGFADTNVRQLVQPERQESAALFREVLTRRFGERGTVNVKSMGRWLGRAEGVVEGNLRFAKKMGHGGIYRWGVQPIS